MTFSRREFLATVGATTALSGVACGAPTPAPASPAQAPAPEPSPDVSTWEKVRASFALAPKLVHMSGFFLASNPAPVRRALEAHRHGLDADPFSYLEDNVEQFERALRAAASDYCGVPGDSFAFTESTTMGLGTIYSGLRLQPGQVILTSEHDHPSTRRSLDHCAARTGAMVKRIRLYQDPAETSADEIIAAVAAGLTPATRVVALTWVHSSTGVRIPVEEIAAVIRAANARRGPEDQIVFAVDGVHGFGIEDVTLAELGADFFIAGCHKWIFGPRGTGLVHGTPAAWALTSPTIPSFDGMWRGAGNIPPAGQMTPGGFHAFEHRWALAEAFRFHLAIGKPRVAARIHELNLACKEGLARMGHVKLHTPRAARLSAGIICFEVARGTLAEAKARLRAQGIIASLSPYDPSYLRLAPSLVTSERDVERALAGVRLLA